MIQLIWKNTHSQAAYSNDEAALNNSCLPDEPGHSNKENNSEYVL